MKDILALQGRVKLNPGRTMLERGKGYRKTSGKCDCHFVISPAADISTGNLPWKLLPVRGYSNTDFGCYTAGGES